jgi:hypothetical protein
VAASRLSRSTGGVLPSLTLAPLPRPYFASPAFLYQRRRGC